MRARDRKRGTKGKTGENMELEPEDGKAQKRNKSGEAWFKPAPT